MPDIKQQISQSQKLSQGLRTTIHLLALDMGEMNEELTREMEKNPALEIVPPKYMSGYRNSRFSPDQLPIPDHTSPLEDLKRQLRINISDTETRHCAMQLLHRLDRHGWLGQSLASFARDEGIRISLAQKALDAVQALEPSGIGARDLTECLLLQLRSLPDIDPLCLEIVTGNLEEASTGSLRHLAQALCVPTSRVEHCMDIIRGLNPAPVDLDEDDIRYILPEFTVEVMPDGRYDILFYNDYYPTFQTDENFASLARVLTGEEKAFARRYIVSAKQLLKAIDLRQRTMEKLAAFITEHQQPFFQQNGELLPLAVSEAAEVLGVHQTTVYRALSGKYLSCKRGTFPLISFFQREVSGFSAMSVQDRVRSIRLSNSKLSDREIAEMLEKEGIHIARRTVSKYRQDMDLKSSYIHIKR